jgi:hypothetical protein
MSGLLRATVSKTSSSETSKARALLLTAVRTVNGVSKAYLAPGHRPFR